MFQKEIQPPQPPARSPFFLAVSCSGACVRGKREKKIYFYYSDFDCLKSACSVYPCHFFCLFRFVFCNILRCCLSFLTANPNFFFLKRHGPGWKHFSHFLCCLFFLIFVVFFFWKCHGLCFRIVWPKAKIGLSGDGRLIITTHGSPLSSLTSEVAHNWFELI